MELKKRECLFCRDTDLSNEHVFPQWLLNELNLRRVKLGMSHQTFFGQQVSTRPLTPNSLVNGLVCKKCNNTWLSQIEDRIKPLIIELTKTKEIDSMVFQIRENHETLAFWAYKTAIILNYASNFNKIVPKRHFKYLYQKRRIPENVNILLGFSRTPEQLNWVQSQMVMHVGDNNDYLVNNPRFHDIHKITMQIDELLLKIIYSPFYDYSYSYDATSHLMLYPKLQRLDSFTIADNLHSFDIEGSLYEQK